MGWRVKRYLDTPGDRLIPWTLLALGLLGLSLLVLLPYLEQVCVDNRREFSGMVSLISPLARQATWVIPAVALAGVLAARLRRPRLAVAAYGVLAVAIAWFTFQTLMVLTPLMCDKPRVNTSGGWRPPRTCSSWGPSKSLNTGPPWNITPGAISSWSSGTACPSFLTRCPRLGLHHHSGTPAGAVAGPRKVFLLLDNATPPEPFLQDATAALTLPGKRLLVNHP